jgi:hypothetical protein
MAARDSSSDVKLLSRPIGANTSTLMASLDPPVI